MLWPNVVLNRDGHQCITHHMDDGYSKLAYETRIVKLARQVEKLSYMLDLMDVYSSLSMEGAAREWQREHASPR